MRSAQTSPPFTGFTQLAHPSRCSRSSLTTFCFLCSCFSPYALIMVSKNTNPANLHCCCGAEAETGFVPTSAQFFSVGTFLILRSPSWTRSCIQKHSVSKCFVRCPAPKRSVKELAVELSLYFSIFIGIPKSWYMDLKHSPT